MLSQILSEYWQAIAGIVGGIAWAIRCESRINRAEEKIHDIKKEADIVEAKVIGSIDAMQKSMTELTVQLARMMERMEHMNKHVSTLKELGLKEFLKETL